MRGITEVRVAADVEPEELAHLTDAEVARDLVNTLQQLGTLARVAQGRRLGLRQNWLIGGIVEAVEDLEPDFGGVIACLEKRFALPRRTGPQ